MTTADRTSLERRVMASWARNGSPERSHVIRAGFLGLGLLYPAIMLAVVFAGSIGRVRQNFADDAYYYALIAHNIADGRGSTFGGMVPTNGFQPLWQLLLVPIAAVSSGDGQVRLTMGLAAVLFAWFVWLAWKLSERLRAYPEGLYAIGYAATIGTLFGNQFFNGMELALVVPSAMLVILVLLEVPQYGERGPGKATRHGLLLGLAVLLLTLSRLDALAFPVAYALITLPRQRNPSVWRTWIVAALVATAGLMTYAVWNLTNYGTPVPISGLAKALGGGTKESVVSLLGNYVEFGGVGPVTPLCLGLQATVASGIALWLLRRGRRAKQVLFSAWHDTCVSHIIQALVLGQLLQLGYYAATSSWPLWEWYYYYIPVQFMLAGTVIIRAAFRKRWSGVLRRPTVTAALVLVAVAAALGLFIHDDPKTSWTTTSNAVGSWIDRNTPSNAVIAMGDRAGGALWASHRRSVQLEGLVEDAGYLSVLRTHTIPQYMAEQSVDYYVRGSTAGDTTGRVPVPGRPGCWSFTEPGQGRGPKSSVVVCDQDLIFSSTQDDGSLWQIWVFRPERQDS